MGCALGNERGRFLSAAAIVTLRGPRSIFALLFGLVGLVRLARLGSIVLVGYRVMSDLSGYYRDSAAPMSQFPTRKALEEILVPIATAS